MNGTCKNLLLDKQENKYIRKTYFNRNLKTTSVNQKWTTDVSEFKTAMSKLYLSPILDMHSRKIVGYDISTTPSLFQTYRMLDMAFSKFFHSNQGWQYQHFSY
ncbi:MAG: DDE-type integrase/transposase/recombinase [Thomasclavelia ramosa]